MASIYPVSMICRGLNESQAKRVEELAAIKKVDNIFPEAVYRNLKEKINDFLPCKHHGINEKLYLFPNKSHYGMINFSQTYQVLNPEHFISNSKFGNAELPAIMILALERFAQIYKLEGSHPLHVNFYRVKFHKEVKTSLKNVQLDWHYDLCAKHTFVMLLQDDIPYQAEEGIGLDIAENQISGPHDPWEVRNCIPNKGFISYQYPENGGIGFSSRKGKTIHQRSVLAEALADANRSVLQIKVANKAWGELD